MSRSIAFHANRREIARQFRSAANLNQMLSATHRALCARGRQVPPAAFAGEFFRLARCWDPSSAADQADELTLDATHAANPATLQWVNDKFFDLVMLCFDVPADTAHGGADVAEEQYGAVYNQGRFVLDSRFNAAPSAGANSARPLGFQMDEHGNWAPLGRPRANDRRFPRGLPNHTPNKPRLVDRDPDGYAPVERGTLVSRKFAIRKDY